MEFTTYTLPNGIRGIHRRIKGNVTHCALLVNAGSRDELKNQFGLAHFTEHALFKGTEHRKAYQVNCRLENLGGELNAFTTKEDTTIHATTLRSDFSKAVELIADVAFHSTFPTGNWKREGDHLRRNQYLQGLSGRHDLRYVRRDAFRRVGAGTQYFRPEIEPGTLQRRVDPGVRRTHAHHRPDGFSSIGNLSAKSVETTVARYLNDIKSSARDFSRRQPAAVEPFSRIVTKHTHQTHCIIGARAQGINDAERLPLALLVNLLGGPSANSLLNVLVREKNGLSYNIEASYTPYSDSGIVAIYFSCDHDNTDHCIELIEGELGRLQTTPLSARRLSMAKKQFIAQLAISMESNEGYMLGAGKSFLAHREVDTMEEVYRKIQALTAEDLTAVASSVFSSPSRLIYK